MDKNLEIVGGPLSVCTKATYFPALYDTTALVGQLDELTSSLTEDMLIWLKIQSGPSRIQHWEGKTHVSQETIRKEHALGTENVQVHYLFQPFPWTTV